MKITSYVKNNGYLRINDLEGGECFCFMDDENIYMKSDNFDDIILLCDGTIIDIYDNFNFEDKPIKRVDAELIVKETENREESCNNISDIVRRIDDFGRLVIPKEIRRALKIKEGTPLGITIQNDYIILRKAEC